MAQPKLRPQDVLVLAKLLVYPGQRPSMAQMAGDLGLSASEVHASLLRLQQSRLIASGDAGARPVLQAVEEFLLHGVKYAFPLKRGSVARGLPTSYAAPPLNRLFAGSSDLPPVWPHEDGVQGVAIEPLYRTAAAAALRDQSLYEVLALIDAVREGRVRERKLAEEHLVARIRGQANGRP